MARLTEDQIQRMRPFVVPAPEGRITRARYPTPRRRRAPIPGIDDGIPLDALAALPWGAGPAHGFTRLFSFFIREVTNGEMAVAVSDRFTGPAFIGDGFWQPNIQSAVNLPILGITASPDDSQRGANQPIAIVNGRQLFTRPAVATDGGETLPPGEGLAIPIGFGGALSNPFTIGVWIEMPEFYLKVWLHQRAAGASNVFGWISVTEGAAPPLPPLPANGTPAAGA